MGFSLGGRTLSSFLRKMGLFFFSISSIALTHLVYNIIYIRKVLKAKGILLYSYFGIVTKVTGR